MPARHTTIGCGLAIVGASLVPLGIFISVLVPVEPGIDSYVPPFLGMVGGCAVGTPIGLTGVAALIMAWQRRRAASSD